MAPALLMPADGLPPRRAFTVDDVLRMQDAGIFDPDEKFELIEGEIVGLPPNSSLHERIKLTLNRALSRSLPDAIQLGVATTLYLSKQTFLEPDLTIFPMMATADARGPDILLAIEVADSTLAFDRGRKARLYAQYGVQELWVIDARSSLTYVHKAPVNGEWTSIETKSADAVLTHSSAPSFAVTLRDI